MLLAAWLLLSGLLLAQPRSLAAERMMLVPLAPGGARDLAPRVGLADNLPVAFGAWIDPDLHGLEVDKYLQQRTSLAAAHYEVLVYAVDNGAYSGPGTGIPTAILPVESGIDTASLPGPGLYAWAVRATVMEADAAASSVVSPLLYFQVADAVEGVVALTSAPSRQAVAELQRLQL